MREIRRRIQKMESQTKVELKTVRELIDFVLSAQRGVVSIHSARIGTDLLNIPDERERAEIAIAQYMRQTGKSREAAIEVLKPYIPLVHQSEAQMWQQRAKGLAEKHNLPIEDVKRHLVERKPELAQFLL